MTRDINSDLLHGLDHQRIQPAGFDLSAFRLKPLTAEAIEKRFCHLPAGAVMNADEKDFLFSF